VLGDCGVAWCTCLTFLNFRIAFELGDCGGAWCTCLTFLHFRIAFVLGDCGVVWCTCLTFLHFKMPFEFGDLLRGVPVSRSCILGCRLSLVTCCVVYLSHVLEF
jgi:hypothetical protein